MTQWPTTGGRTSRQRKILCRKSNGERSVVPVGGNVSDCWRGGWRDPEEVGVVAVVLRVWGWSP